MFGSEFGFACGGGVVEFSLEREREVAEKGREWREEGRERAVGFHFLLGMQTRESGGWGGTKASVNA